MRAGREIHLHLSYTRAVPSGRICRSRPSFRFLVGSIFSSHYLHWLKHLRIRIDKGGRSVVHPPRAGHPVRHRWVSSYPFLLMVIITCQSLFPWSMGTTASVLGQFSLSVVVHVETGLLRSHRHETKPAVPSSGTLREWGQL